MYELEHSHKSLVLLELKQLVLPAISAKSSLQALSCFVSKDGLAGRRDIISEHFMSAAIFWTSLLFVSSSSSGTDADRYFVKLKLERFT